MNSLPIQTITNHFKALNEVVPLHPIRSEREYNKAVNVMNQLLDAGGANEKHALADLVDTLSELIGDYEDSHYQATPASPVAVLRLLMEQHELTQTDLPEIGSQGVVSEVLKGKRDINVRQANALAERFGVSAVVFLELTVSKPVISKTVASKNKVSPKIKGAVKKAPVKKTASTKRKKRAA
jgi:HTH-type transcriptional regulator/antitoxin HigA